MADNNPQAGQGRPLPKKEQDLFRNLVKYYESKQYKKAVKAADAILKKFPNHGETLAMKGLTLANGPHGLEKREEAHELVKLGLRNDMRSHVCWHVYGLLHRSERNYNEAIKAYKQALRIEKDNFQILRDLSLLQIQMRDLHGFTATRQHLLGLKPNSKANWITFALARDVTGDYEGAIQLIDAYLGTLPEDAPELGRGFESGELLLYRNTILAEIPDNFQNALNHLDKIEKIVVDRGAWLMAKARYQMHLGRYEEARTTLLSNMDRGATDDYRVQSGYMCAVLELDGASYDEAVKVLGTDTIATTRTLSNEQKKVLLDTYRGDLVSKYPRSPAIQRIPLTLVDGEEFRSEADAYCRKRLSKGVPSLCIDLSSFILGEKDGKLFRLTEPVDVKAHPVFVTLVDLANGYTTNLEASNKFSPDDEKEEEPSTILWAWFLRAGLHELAGEYSEGIALLDKCVEHTPTAVDVYELKARLQKAAGDIKSAVDSLEKGRNLDLQDRYINNQTTKYMLQADMPETALERIALFTKHEGNPEDNLFSMQCSWYELELAECLAKKEIWGKSLKKYGAVVKHFEDYHEDQFDFHSYCVRKATLRTYRDLLRFADNLWGQPYYGRAAEGIIRIYLYLHDNPSITKEEEEPDYSKMSAAERKKAKAIARKKKKAAEKKAAEEAERKKKKEEEAIVASEDGKKKKHGATPVVVDKDPDGLELLKLDPLEEAKKYSAILSKNAPNCLATWMLQYDVAIRRGKGLLALQALFKAKAIDSMSGELFTRTVDFALNSEKLAGDNPVVQEVIASETAAVLDNKSVDNVVAAGAEKIKSDPLTALPYRVAVAKALVLTKKSSATEAANLVLVGGIDARGMSVSSCREALKALKEMDAAGDAVVSNWVAIVKERFPLAKDFE